MQTRRWLVITLVLILLAAALAYGFIPRALLVETAVVRQAPLQVTLLAEGKTRVKDRYVISAPVAGIARRIGFEIGDNVRQGQILAWLAPLQSRVLDPRSRAQAQANLAAAQAALQVAQANEHATLAATDYVNAELNRLRRLRKTGVVSQEALEQAETAARKAEAEWHSAAAAVEVAKYRLESARSELQYSAARSTNPVESIEQVTLKAPVDGLVLKVYQRSEYVVEPGRPLLEIGDPGNLEVEIDVLSADAVRISIGTKVFFERWGGDELLEGRVQRVEPVGFTKISALGVEEQRVLVIADLVSKPADWSKLGDGYRVEARFILWENDKVLQIPTSALLRYQGDWAVFVVEQGRARRQRIELGQRSGLSAEITAGLTVAMTVITHPANELTDGTRVEVNQ